MSHARRFLQVTSYPPPRAGWGVRVQFLKRLLEQEGHACAVLNTGPSRTIPSPEYDTVLGGVDFVRKVWRYSRAGHVVHAHANGKSPKGFVLTLLALALNRAAGHRPFLTFHAGEQQRFFPRDQAPWLVPVFKLMFGMPQRIVCNSAGVKARILEYGVPAGKVECIQAFSRQYLEFLPVSLGDRVERFYEAHPHVLFSYLHMQPGYHPSVLAEAFTKVAARHPGAALVICGMLGHRDPGVWERVEATIDGAGLRPRVCLIDDLDHDQFLTALTRAAIYVRTPPADGVASSVLEALSLRVPVVAAENGTRPAGVVTYPPDDATALANAISRVLATRDEIAAALPRPHIDDTLRVEADLLLA